MNIKQLNERLRQILEYYEDEFDYEDDEEFKEYQDKVCGIAAKIEEKTSNPFVIGSGANMLDYDSIYPLILFEFPEKITLKFAEKIKDLNIGFIEYKNNKLELSLNINEKASDTEINKLVDIIDTILPK